MFSCKPRFENPHSEFTETDLIERSNKIDKELERERTRNKFTMRLLLLGPGESGKSTVVKQMKLKHKKMSSMDYEKVKYTIYANIFTSLGNIIMAMTKLGIVFENHKREADAEEVLDAIENDEYRHEPSPTMIHAMERLWADKGIQECYTRRAEYQLNDSAKYFLDQLCRIGDIDYLPNTQDLLCARARTTGINEITFAVKQLTFIVTDVGGQETERRKWIHCFENVNALIFVADVSAFNLMLREDNQTNRLLDGVQLFDYVINNDYFTDTSMIVFFNKVDIFAQKLKEGISIKPLFPDYQTKALKITENAMTLWLKNLWFRKWKQNVPSTCMKPAPPTHNNYGMFSTQSKTQLSAKT